MNENQKEIKEDESDDDLEAYLREMENLESDFSDLDDLDMEELKDMQDAISKVREQETGSNEQVHIEEFSPTDFESFEIETETTEETEYFKQKEAMITDFSDIEQIDFDELRDMKDAIETVKQEEIITPTDITGEIKRSQDISLELEERIKQELMKKKEKEEKEIITPDKFLEYIKSKRDKIWYHALYYLVCNVEDHIATKALLYDVLKEVTSKSPIDPIPEHQFYFGLGYILRLTLNDKKIIRFMSGGKFKINVHVDNLRGLLEQTGEPISKRPIIEEDEKKKMFSDFLKDDFSDI